MELTRYLTIGQMLLLALTGGNVVPVLSDSTWQVHHCTNFIVEEMSTENLKISPPRIMQPEELDLNFN